MNLSDSMTTTTPSTTTTSTTTTMSIRMKKRKLEEQEQEQVEKKEIDSTDHHLDQNRKIIITKNSIDQQNHKSSTTQVTTSATSTSTSTRTATSTTTTTTPTTPTSSSSSTLYLESKPLLLSLSLSSSASASASASTTFPSPSPYSSLHPTFHFDLYHQIFNWLSSLLFNSSSSSTSKTTPISLFHQWHIPFQLPTLELEMKLGRMLNKSTHQRLSLPITCETILQPFYQQQFRFESDMTLRQHAHYNQLLNSLVTSSPHQLKYTHLYETDRFFNRGYQDKVRVSFHSQSNTIVPNGIVRKTKLGSLDIHLPLSPLDLRISLNVEQTVPFPRGVQVDPLERKKDRLSYAHDWIQVDLTQVKTVDRNVNQVVSVTHELEFELPNFHLLFNWQEKKISNPKDFHLRFLYLFQNAKSFAEKALPFRSS